MRARTRMFAFAASAAATLLQPADSFAAQTVSGPLYEDAAGCIRGDGFCTVTFSTYPDIPGKYIRLTLLTCNITSPFTLSTITISNVGGSIPSRFQYISTGSKLGVFTISEPIDFVVTSNPTRYPFVAIVNNGDGALVNSPSGICTLSGLIFTP